jgi:hypothetical protein
MQLRFRFLFLIVPFCFISTISLSQVNGSDVRNNVLKLFDDVDLENKILFINVWKSDNFESRENNKEFVRVSKIYQQAKLRNGSKGVCYINISLDDPAMWRISLKKDSIDTKYSLENGSGKYNGLLTMFDNKPGNIVIGNDGEVLSNNLKKDNCFYLFRSLITR